MATPLPTGMTLSVELDPAYQTILTTEACEFLIALHREFNTRRLALLDEREQRQLTLDQGKKLDFLAETIDVRDGAWQVNKTPFDLENRRVEITGPVERKMMINALNSGANVFMGDFEDSLSPTWDNVMQGQINCMDAVRRQLDFDAPNGKHYELNNDIATLLIRPRGWHLSEKHLLVDNERMSASLVDFGLYFFHNAHATLENNTGPYFYLPKLEHYLEARLWNDVFCFAQDYLEIPRGTIRATVLIETLPAAFQMEEILYELRDHMSGLNAGRWDYIFSVIKTFAGDSQAILPNRDQVTMTVPFMRAYTQLLIQTCHKRGAHAMGGMAAFVPSRKDAEVNATAIEKVREDKSREANDGCDGTWVAHPDLVAIAKVEFDKVLGNKANQKDKLREDVSVNSNDLTDLTIKNSTITETGIRHNIRVALQYLNAWIQGYGCVALYNLMEDAATAEISRAQLWQWLNHHAHLDDGRVFDKALYTQLFNDELEQLNQTDFKIIDSAKQLFNDLVLDKQFKSFLTLSAYEQFT